LTGTDDTTNPLGEAADPATPLTRLQELAEHHPETRAVIAANPSTYPGLLEWLSELGDPEIDGAIAARRARTAGVDPSAPSEAPVRRPTAERFAGAGAGAAATQRPAETTAETPATRAAGPARPVTPTDGSAVVTRTPDAPPNEVQPERRSTPWAGILAVAAALVVLVLGGVWIFNLPGGDDETTNAGATDPAFPPLEEDPDESGSDAPAPADTDELADAISVLEAVPSSSSCEDTGPDIEAITQFAAAAAPEGTWGDPAHGDLVIDTLKDLKDECGREHAQAVVDQIIGEPNTNAALRNAIQSDLSWLEIPEIPADAQQMPGFAVAGANMACVLSGSDVVCTVVGHNLDTPEGCLPGGISLEIDSSGAAAVNCNRSSNADPLLSDGQSAYNGSLACTVEGTEVNCWSTESGEGFRLGPSTLELY
jgi:hypothetical protein